MTAEVIAFICILIINTFAACAYFVWGFFVQPRRHKEDENNEKENKDDENNENAEDDKKEDHQRLSRSGYALKVLVILLCPIVGVLFFLFSELLYICLFRSEADLEDVIFAKDKVVSQRRAEEERERNRVPLEEALAVCDKNSMRDLMLDIIRGNVENSLASIALALNSEDTETSHYAASVLRDALNDFRQKSQDLYNAMQERGPQSAEYACTLIEYMNGVLVQEVFRDLEQRTFIEMMEDACNYLYESPEDRHLLLCDYIEWIALHMLHIKNYDHMKVWCERIMEMYPNELAAYTVQLKLYFSIQDKEKFFDAMDRLKKSDVVIDRDTLDLIRVFS